jgi:hypothetical protein
VEDGLVIARQVANHVSDDNFHSTHG